MNDQNHGDAYEGPDAPSGGGDDIQAGYYRARAIEGSEQFGFSKNGGEQVAIVLELLDLRRQVTTLLAFGGNGMGPSIERLKALGWDGNPAGLAGIGTHEVQCEIKYEDWQGKISMRAEIKTRDGKFSFKAPMAEQQKRGFLAELAKVAAQVDGGGAPPAPASRPAQGGPPAKGGYPSDWDKGTTGPGRAPAQGQGGRVNLR